MKIAALRAELDKLAGQREHVVGERRTWSVRLADLQKVDPARWGVTEANRKEAHRRIAVCDEQIGHFDEKTRALRDRLPAANDVAVAQASVEAIEREAAQVANQVDVRWRQLLHRLRQAEAECRVLAPLREQEQEARGEVGRLADRYGVRADLPDPGPDAGERREALLLVALLKGVVGHGNLRPETLKELKQMRAA